MIIMLKFEWDDNKNQLNIQKHGISFQEAASVFNDDNTILIFDEIHSEHEDRFLLIGFSYRANILIVCRCYRNNNSIIKIISARKATKEESKLYLKNYEKRI